MGLIAFTAITFIAAALGAVASIEAKTFYASLNQPEWAPPAGVFGPVWTALYVLMSISIWLVWRKQPWQNIRVTLTVYILQLAFNALWSWLFFAWHLGHWAFMNIVLLWSLIVIMIYTFWRIKPIAAVLQIPYLLWVTFAAILNFSVWQANPILLG